jgi:TusE/DsrC/DsvC family sulfur relay protein
MNGFRVKTIPSIGSIDFLLIADSEALPLYFLCQNRHRPAQMNNTGIGDMNTQPARDAEGYLFEPDNWDESIAAVIAREEGIKLNDSYWQALHFMRKYYLENNIAPDVRHLITYMKTETGCSKKEAKKLVFDLFPYGYVKQACKIAGMKKPRAWSTG